MKPYLILIVLAFMLISCSDDRAETIQLYHDEIKAKSGKDMSLREIRREAGESVIVVDGMSDSTVGSSLFIVKAMYSIAVMREKQYFYVKKEWEDGNGYFYLVGFADSEIGLPRDKVLSVDQYKTIFKSGTSAIP